MRHIDFGQTINRLLYTEKINGKRVRIGGGIQRAKVDERDFHVGIFGFGDYKPQAPYKLIKTLGVKDQGNFNTCGWNSVTVQKEIDEGVQLSVRSLVAYAKKAWLLSGDGISDLRANQKAVQDFGIAEQTLVNENAPLWPDYSSPTLLTPAVVQNANSHRSKSFFAVNNKNDALKMLDSGRALATGLMWYSGYNMSAGFAAPWIISGIKGVSVGGHAFQCIGYVMGYKGIDANNHLVYGPGGRDVFAFQQSYGADWGATVVDDDGVEHKGLFFIDMNWFEANRYERYAQLDITIDTAQFLMKYGNMNVKTKSSPAVYFIDGDVRRAYPDQITFWAFGGTKYNITTIDDADVDTFNNLARGNDMRPQDGPFWPIMQTAAQPYNAERILQIIHQISVNDVHVSYNVASKQWTATGLDSIT